MTKPAQLSTPRPAFSVSAIWDLFIRPTRYFGTVGFSEGDFWFLAAWVAGISWALGRIDRELLRAELGEAQAAATPLVASLGSWGSFWAFLLVAGALGGALVWYLWGWWYNLRIRWSGASLHDERVGRTVFIASHLVVALPTVTWTGIQTVLYQDYAAAWQAGELWSDLLLVFPFWSVVVSYRGVRATFPVIGARARWWFLFLPIVTYALAFGLLAGLFWAPTEGTSV